MPNFFIFLAAVGVVGCAVAMAGTIAASIVSPNFPILRAVLAWTILLAPGIALYYSWRRVDTRQRTRHRELMELLALTPAQFEDAVGNMLRDYGFRRVQRVGASGDLCADLTGIDPEGRSVVVQCKRYSPGMKISSPDIQKFIGMAFVHHKAARGIFVTTATFTGPAIQLAETHPLDLWDGTKLSAMLGEIHAR